MEYNQLCFCTVLKKHKLVKFMCYRKDIEKVIYEFEGSVYQCLENKIYPATASEIFDYYERKINLLKKHIKYQNKKIREHKYDYKQYMKEIQKIKVDLKNIHIELFGYKIMDKIVNENICNDNIKIATQMQHVNREVRLTNIAQYRMNLRYCKDAIKKLKDKKQELGSYKKERKQLLEGGIYIEDREGIKEIS